MVRLCGVSRGRGWWWDRGLGYWELALAAAVAACGGSGARADVDPSSGIDFVRVGATYSGAGNPAIVDTSLNSSVNGRGSVNYEYRIGRFEVTNAQWIEFANAVYDRPAGDTIPFVTMPNLFGQFTTPVNTSNPSAIRFQAPAGLEMLPIGGVTWHTAAIYANWLCNGKSTSRAAFMSGAYDVSTFDTLGNDQPAHTPGAPYWIPTWDEWLKAAHYDPNKSGLDQGGWWTYSTSSDTAPAYGPPGVRVRNNGRYWEPDPAGVLAQANSGWTRNLYPNLGPSTVPLGAYAGVASPWGLIDAAGGKAEWTESIDRVNQVNYRIFEGSDLDRAGLLMTHADSYFLAGGAELTYIPGFENGLRIAALVPAPPGFAFGAGVFLIFGGASRRRRHTCVGVHFCNKRCAGRGTEVT